MMIENTVLIDKWLLINADDKGSWKYLFLIEGKLHSLSEAQELYERYSNQPERLNPEDIYDNEEKSRLEDIHFPSE